MAAPTFDQQLNGTNNTPAFTNNPPAGACIFFIVHHSTGTISAVSGCGATWSRVTGSGALGTQDVWMGKNCSGAAKTITITGATGNVTVKGFSFGNVDTVNPLVAWNITQSSPGTAGSRTPTITPSSAYPGCVVLWSATDFAGADYTGGGTGAYAAGSVQSGASAGNNACGGSRLASAVTGVAQPCTWSNATNPSWPTVFIAEFQGAALPAVTGTAPMGGGASAFLANGHAPSVGQPTTPNLPLEVRVYAAASPNGSPIDTWEGHRGLTWADLWNATGSGSLELPAGDPSASTANLTRYNLVRIFCGPFDRFQFWLETPVRRFGGQGSAEETVRVVGRSLEAYLARAIVTPAATYAAQSAGQIMRDQIVQAQARGALSLLRWDFSAAVDSAGVAWPGTLASLALQFGEGRSLLDVLGDLRQAGCYATLGPDFMLHLWGTDPGEDLTGAVVLRQGIHFRGLGEVTQAWAGAANYMLARATVAGTSYAGTATDGGATLPDRFEGYVAGPDTTDTATLAQVAAAEITARYTRAQAVRLPVARGSGAGQYEPYQHYRLGSKIALHAPPTFDRSSQRVASINGTAREGGQWDVDLDLGATKTLAAVSQATTVARLSAARSG